MEYTKPRIFHLYGQKWCLVHPYTGHWKLPGVGRLIDTCGTLKILLIVHNN